MSLYVSVNLSGLFSSLATGLGFGHTPYIPQHHQHHQPVMFASNHHFAGTPFGYHGYQGNVLNGLAQECNNTRFPSMPARTPEHLVNTSGLHFPDEGQPSYPTYPSDHHRPLAPPRFPRRDF